MKMVRTIFAIAALGILAFFVSSQQNHTTNTTVEHITTRY